jgi:hypothetical protein
LKPAIKKITTFFFTLLGVAPLLFTIFIVIKQQVIHHKMEQQLESKMLHTIALAESDIHWLKEGKEMLINGRMFDVKTFKNSGIDKVVITGLFDEEETLLVNQVKKQHQNDTDNGTKILAQFFQLLQITHDNTAEENFIPFSPGSNYFQGDESRPASPFITILTPPPQV